MHCDPPQTLSNQSISHLPPILNTAKFCVWILEKKCRPRKIKRPMCSPGSVIKQPPLLFGWQADIRFIKSHESSAKTGNMLPPAFNVTAFSFALVKPRLHPRAPESTSFSINSRECSRQSSDVLLWRIWSNRVRQGWRWGSNRVEPKPVPQSTGGPHRLEFIFASDRRSWSRLLKRRSAQAYVSVVICKG